MTTKEMINFVGRKYDKKKQRVCSEYSKLIVQCEKEYEGKLDEINNAVDEFINRLTEKNELVRRHPNAKSSWVNIYNYMSKETEGLKKEQEYKLQQLEKEKQNLIDELLILGVKDEKSKEILLKLTRSDD